ncbi:MAG: DUF899 family protein [Armatimonadetes bacterium]|nr:DUF899 family protein [Armatimonadota bacterium]MDE2206687.1 DUF899 family protein [Armatimonadota bacterium]
MEAINADARDASVAGELEALDAQIAALRKRQTELRRLHSAMTMSNYTFRDKSDGPVTLLQLFGDRSDLLVVHNMGQRCNYCSLWADGLNGVLPHILRRTAFAVSSPDSPEEMSAISARRGWQFPMVSIAGTTFAADCGFLDDEGMVWPGVSSFHREPHHGVHRISSATFGPGDEFCAIWHLFDLLQEGAAGWEPH